MGVKKTRRWNKMEIRKCAVAVIGSLVYALGMNLFIVPSGLYSGGIMGFCQLFRTFLVERAGLPLNGFDLSGVLYYLVNLPLFVMAFRTMGKFFFIKTVVCVSTVSLSMSLIPIPAMPILEEDVLGSCLIGGIVTGFGSGLVLKMGSSQGGLDILGLYFIKKKGNTSIGKISLIVNFALYAICLFMFDVSTVIYSVIFAAAAAFTVDKIHSQNINMQALIITKKPVREMEEDIFSDLGRGVTQWSAKGAYTNADANILLTVLSKYEIPQLKRIVHSHDPEAFVIVLEGADIDGNYMKKLTD